MSQCLNRTIPSYIDVTKAQQRIKNYLDNKQPVLSEWAGKEENTSLSISTKLFLQLVDELNNVRDGKTVSGVRIYFASYMPGASADAYIPQGQEKLLTLIFVPTYQPASEENEQANFNDYYIIDYNTSAVANLNTATGDINKFDWVSLYQTEEIPVLENAPKDPPVSETKTVWFAITDFADWVDEIACYAAKGTPVSNIYFAFAAYGTDETFTFKMAGKDVTVSVANQLTLIVSIYPGFTSYTMPVLTDGGGSNFNSSTPCPPAKCV